MNVNASGAAEERSNPSRRILVADDDAAIRKLLTCALSGAGYSVEAVENGAEAWEALQDHHFDLLVTDNNMPKMSGLQLLGRVQESNLDLPVIMASATVPEAVFTESNDFHPAAILFKPFDLAELVETVNLVLRTIGGSTTLQMSN
jgi:CheY-like chemotaxis protein